MTTAEKSHAIPVIRLSSTKKGRVHGMVWMILWIAVIIIPLVLLNIYISDIYTANHVGSYAELERAVGHHRYGSNDADNVFWSRIGQGACSLLLVLLSWGLLNKIFAWKAVLEIELDDDGYAKVIRSIQFLFPRGQAENVIPVERIQEISVSQSIINGMLGVGSIHIAVSTFVLNKVHENTISIDGVSDPHDEVERIKNTIRPHQGMLLVHQDGGDIKT